MHIYVMNVFIVLCAIVHVYVQYMFRLSIVAAERAAFMNCTQNCTCNMVHVPTVHTH